VKVSGWTIRAAGLLSGRFPLLLRAVGPEAVLADGLDARGLAALDGSVLTRLGLDSRWPRVCHAGQHLRAEAIRDI